jgi:hypothetical protein
MLSEYEISGHIAKKKFMPDYLVLHQHGEVQPSAAAESDENDDEDRMDNMIADIGMEYDLGSEDQHPPPQPLAGFWPPRRLTFLVAGITCL